MAPVDPAKEVFNIPDSIITKLQSLSDDLSSRKIENDLAPAIRTTTGEAIEKDKDLHLINPYGSLLQRSHGIVAGLIVLTTVIILSPIFVPFTTILAAMVTLGVLVMTRHFYLVKKHLNTKEQQWMVASDKDTAPDISKLPASYFLYVFGSGGHTTEMVAMLKLSLRPNQRQHRRYIMTSGDKHSMSQEVALEAKIHETFTDGNAGTYDTLVVTRARAVYQSYLTAIISSLKCALEILVALVKIPDQRVGDSNAEAFRYPHVIVTNGPGTGFIVCLVAHFLKILFLAPENRLKVVFVETWARIHEFGLTGKLFNWTGIADLLVVQSDTLSKIVDKPNIGNVNMRFADIRR